MSEIDEILSETGSLAIYASAGTGKTTVLTKKIMEDINSNYSYHKIAALTFTIKAANEIRKRIPTIEYGNYIGTINRFAIQEVIQPFFKDVYGEEYNKELSVDYNTKIDSFEKGIQLIKDKNTIGTYRDAKEDFIFDLAIFLFNKSEVCKLYLLSKYRRLYIDEYQDCNETMHRFFIDCCFASGITVFIAGDEKQSIYNWRGAKPELFKKLCDNYPIRSFKLYVNYRSCKAIQNYSYLLDNETSKYYEKIDPESHVVLINCNSENIANKIISVIDPNSSLAILAYSNDKANMMSKKLTDAKLETRYCPTLPIYDISNETRWLFSALSYYLTDDTYSEYDVLYEMPFWNSDDNKTTMKIIQCLKSLRNHNTREEFISRTNKLMSIIGNNCDDEDTNKLYKTVTEDIYRSTLYRDRYPRTSSTIHSSKGLEFDQVVIFADDYGNLSDDFFNIHYVAVTRAKEKLIIVYRNNDKSMSFLKKLKSIYSERGINPNDVLYDIDDTFSTIDDQ